MVSLLSIEKSRDCFMLLLLLMMVNRYKLIKWFFTQEVISSVILYHKVIIVIMPIMFISLRGISRFEIDHVTELFRIEKSRDCFMLLLLLMMVNSCVWSSHAHGMCPTSKSSPDVCSVQPSGPDGSFMWLLKTYKGNKPYSLGISYITCIIIFDNLPKL